MGPGNEAGGMGPRNEAMHVAIHVYQPRSQTPLPSFFIAPCIKAIKI